MGVAMMGSEPRTTFHEFFPSVLTLAAAQLKVGDGRKWKPWYCFHCKDRLHWGGDTANGFLWYMNSGNDRSSVADLRDASMGSEQVISKALGHGASLFTLPEMRHSS
jgi:hypothetical protein